MTEANEQAIVSQGEIKETELPPTHFTILRHAPTLWNKEGRNQGNIDTAIDPEALPSYVERAVAAQFPQPDSIVVSGLSRSLVSAEAIKKAYGWDDVEIMRAPELNERKWGICEGKLKEESRQLLLSDPEIAANYPELATVDNPSQIWDSPQFKPPGGESMVELKARIEDALDRIHQAHPGENLLMVSHAGVMISLGLDHHMPQQLVVKDRKQEE